MKKLTVFLILALISNTVIAQWEIISNGQYPTINAIDFPTESIGYACGENFILKTLDGGDNWEYIEINYNFISIDFVSSDIGYASGPNKTICKTTDGGISWSKLNVPYLGSDPICFKEISFRDENNGFIAAGDYITDFDFDVMYAVGYILKTTDGGLSWSVKNIGLEMNAIHIVKNSDLVFAAGGTSAPMGFENILLKSSNFGDSWERIEGTITKPFRTIHSIDEEKIIVSYYSDIFLSSNGADSFEYFNLDTIKPYQYIYNCFFANENEFYIIGKKSLFYSYNIKENSFEKIIIPGLNHDLFSFSIINNTGFIVGSNGLIMRNKAITKTDEIINTNGNINIYPNPTTGIINIECYDNLTYDIKIFNLHQMIFGHSFEGRTAHLSIENLNPGLYFIRISSENGVRVNKVIKL